MKKTTLFITSLLFAMTSFAQQTRTCSTMEHLEYQTSQDPSIKKRMQEIELHTQRRIKRMRNSTQNNTNSILKIPVVVDVLYTNAKNNISNAQIHSQIKVLNEDFRRTNANKNNRWSQAADTRIEFHLAKFDPNGNPTTAITRKKVNSEDWRPKYKSKNAMKISYLGDTNPWNTKK